MSNAVDGVLRQVDVVVSALDDADIAQSISVTPVLCFLRVEWPLLRPPKEFRGVRLESHRSIKRLVTRPTVLMEAEADYVLATLAHSLPPR